MTRFLGIAVDKSPFLEGLLLYSVSMVPIITAVKYAIVVAQFGKTITLGQTVDVVLILLIILSFYCALGSVLCGQDIIVFYTPRQPEIVGVLLVFVSMIYGIFLVLLWKHTMSDKPNYSHLVASLAIGFHFAAITWHPSMLDDVPKPSVFSYFVYMTIFGLILVDRSRATSNVDRQSQIPAYDAFGYPRSAKRKGFLKVL